MKKGIHDELKRFELIIEGALANPTIMQALAKLGYDKKEILRGKDLWLAMENQQNEREDEETNRKEATRQLQATQADAYARYINHVKFARMVIMPQTKVWENMKLTGPRHSSLNQWLVQAEAFYRHTGAVADLLAQRGISAEELAQAKALIAAISNAQVQQNASKSKLQMAKVKRDQERKALQTWMRKFIKMARIAFEEDKQQLEALGIVVANS
jgi:hypothetical protein